MDILITTFGWIAFAVFILCVIAFCVGAMSVFFTLGRKFIGDARWKKHLVRSMNIKNAYVCASVLERWDIPDKENLNIYQITQFFYKETKKK